jgi:hypothetical protein
MTSLAREHGSIGNLDRFRAGMAKEFALAFERRARTVAPEQLVAALAEPVAG